MIYYKHRHLLDAIYFLVNNKVFMYDNYTNKILPSVRTLDNFKHEIRQKIMIKYMINPRIKTCIENQLLKLL